MRNDTGQQLLKFDTNRITNSKMADKMAAVQGMTVSQAFIFNFKSYSVAIFALHGLSFYHDICSYRGIACNAYDSLVL